MRRTWNITRMTLLDLVRRRAVVGLLFLLPLVFYLARHDQYAGQAIKFLLIGLGFTMSTCGLFATCAARSLEPRLRLSGYLVRELYLGRLVAVLAVGLAIASPYLVIVVIDQDVQRIGGIALALALTVLVAAPLGMLLGSLVPRDMEGILLLMAVMSAQLLVDPARRGAEALPLWSARQVATYAVDLASASYLRKGLLHGALYAAALFAVTAAIAAVRLRQRHSRPPAAAPASLSRPGRP